MQVVQVVFKGSVIAEWADDKDSWCEGTVDVCAMKCGACKGCVEQFIHKAHYKIVRITIGRWGLYWRNFKWFFGYGMTDHEYFIER